MSVINSKRWTEAELKAQGFNKIVIGVPGRPFPVMVPNPQAISTEDVFRLEVIEDPENPIMFWSKRNYDEVIGMLYRYLPTPSMLSLFYETLRLLRIDNDRRIQFYIGRHGSGKSFVGKLIGDFLHPDGSVTINCADRDLNELLFETVLDVAANPGLYDKINSKLKRGEMSATSIAALRNVVGDAYSEKEGYPHIDFEEIGSMHLDAHTNEDGQRETEVVFSDTNAHEVVNTLLKIAEVEGLSQEASFMPLKSQLGILPRVWQDGRVAHLEEYNKCKEGTDTCLHPVLQVFNGENLKCRVFGSGNMAFAFDNRERTPGFFCYLDGNMQADGVATHTLSASANDRVLPNIIQNMIKDDWQHRWCQLLTGVPISILYNCNQEQWDANPDNFTKFLHMIRGLGGADVPPLHRHYINRWEDVLEATDMIAQYNFLYDQKTNPDSVLHKEARFPELFTEVDEEFHNMAGGSMRRVIKHFMQAMLNRPKTTLPTSSQGFDITEDWKDPPGVNVVMKHNRPEISLGTSIVTEFYDDMVRLTLGLGKPNLFASLKADFESLRLKRPDLMEGFASEVLYFEDLLNSQKGSADRNLQAQEIFCEQLRLLNPDTPLSDENDHLITIDQVETALHRASHQALPQSEDPRLSYIYVQNPVPLVPADGMVVPKAIIDSFPTRDGKQVDLPPSELISHDRFLIGIALPKVGKNSVNALWTDTLLTEVDSPLAEFDESIRISTDHSREAKLALTTVMTAQNGPNGLSPAPIHLLKDNLKGNLLVVGDQLSESLKSFLKDADIDYVDRNANNARTQVQIFLNKLFPKRGPEVESDLVASFLHRNRIAGQSIEVLVRDLERLNLSDLLSSSEVVPRRPIFVTCHGEGERLGGFLAERRGDMQPEFIRNQQ